MVFPSVPIYLDHHTWLQQHGGDPHVINNPPIVPTLPPTLSPIDGIVGTRPSSMPEHGRIAKVPYGETPLKCPRCESTNTKFCYFNNYSLSQPRHFCKTCRRYWTRGGALRDVPVGGGCRRSSSNKSKGNQSKSPITLQSNPTSTTPIPPNNLLTNNKFIANSNLPIFPSMPNVLELANAGGNNELGFQIGKGTTSASAGTLDLSAASGDRWTSSSSHQLNSNQLSSFSGRFEQPVGAYNFNPLAYDQVGERSSALEVGFAQLSSSSMKHEENQGLSMARNLQRYSGNDQYWSTGNTWRDISGSSSSASHFT